MYGPRRRRLSGWWWLVPIMLVIVGISVLVSNRGTEARRGAAFLDDTRALANEVAQVAAGFSRLVGSELLTVTRPDFDVLMTRLGSQMVLHSSELAELDAPESAHVAREMLGLALASWSVGVEEFRTAVARVADEPFSTDPVDQLGGAIVQLKVGDLLYSRFLERADAMTAELDVAIGEFPLVAFVGDRRDLSSGVGLARTVRDNAEIGIRRDVAILQIVFEPLSSGGVGDDGEIIFPATEWLWFSAVIRNLGSVDQKGMTITVDVRSAAGEVVAIEQSDPVDLAPEETGTVEFEPVPVQPGAEYLLMFDLGQVDDEVNLDDNVWESSIRINPPG